VTTQSGMKSRKWYLTFLWYSDQLDRLLSKISDIIRNEKKEANIMIIHPIFRLENTQSNHVNDIVTLPYLRGFAYYNNNSLVYTGIGCHKVGGILLAFFIRDSDDTVKGKAKEIIENAFPNSTIITIYDVSIDFFCLENIKMQDIKNNLPDDLNIEKSPIITSLGSISVQNFYSEKTKYEDYNDVFSRISELINNIFSKDELKNKISLLVYYREDSKGKVTRKNLQEIHKKFDATSLTKTIQKLFITKPKKISYE